MYTGDSDEEGAIVETGPLDVPDLCDASFEDLEHRYRGSILAYQRSIAEYFLIDEAMETLRTSKEVRAFSNTNRGCLVRSMVISSCFSEIVFRVRTSRKILFSCVAILAPKHSISWRKEQWIEVYRITYRSLRVTYLLDERVYQHFVLFVGISAYINQDTYTRGSTQVVLMKLSDNIDRKAAKSPVWAPFPTYESATRPLRPRAANVSFGSGLDQGSDRLDRSYALDTPVQGIQVHQTLFSNSLSDGINQAGGRAASSGVRWRERMKILQ